MVPLSTHAVAILRELQPLTGHKRYVFTVRGGRPISDNTLLQAMRRLDISQDDTTAHGWRASFRTIGDEVLKQRVDLLEHQLAHSVKDANGWAYNRTKFLDERRKLMQLWSDYLYSLKCGDTPDNVIKGEFASG